MTYPQQEVSESSLAMFLATVGIRPGACVLDFGCGTGNYSIAAARAAGERGRVCALDKDLHQLISLKRKAISRHLTNIECLLTRGQLVLPLRDASVDIVLLYDILHRYYFPEASRREKLLSDLRRVMKPEGMLSIYPTHLNGPVGFTLTALISEVENIGFQLVDTHSGTLVHDGAHQQGTVHNFKKKGKAV